MTVSFDSAHRQWVAHRETALDYRVSILDQLRVSRDVETPSRVFAVVDSIVYVRKRAAIDDFLQELGVPHRVLSLDSGEDAKGLPTVDRIWRELDAWEMGTTGVLIAIGGGALLDTAGFAASLYLGGLRWWRMPTTLNALTDAGVAPEVQINFANGKNRLRAKHPASETFLHLPFLQGLPKSQFRQGAAELLKVAIVRDSLLFDLLGTEWPVVLSEEFQGTTPRGFRAAHSIIELAISGMLDELTREPFPSRINFGHTLSPPWEMPITDERPLRHGDAVNLDMAMSVILATQRGYLTPDQRDLIFQVMRWLGLPLWHKLLTFPGALDAGLHNAVLERGGALWLTVPAGIGSATHINDCDSSELRAAEQELHALANSGP